MRDIFIEIWTTVKHNRLRTALTGFSVAWGIFILIVLLGAGNGLINGIMGNRMNVLTNSMSIYGGQTSKAYDGLGEGRNVELNDKDLAITQHGFESNIDDVGAEIEKSGLNIAYGDNYSTGVSVNGVYPNDVDINKRDMLCGRFLNALDIEQRRKTIVVSQGLAKELMPHAPLNLNGHVVKVDNLAFTVVGIYDSDKSRMDNMAFIPLKLYRTLWHRHHILSLGKHNLGIGAVSTTNLLTACRYLYSRLYLKLIGSILVDSLRRDILQLRIKLKILQCTDSNLHCHTRDKASNLCLIDISSEDKVVHISNRCYCCAIVKGVGEDNRVAHLNRYVKNQSGNSRTYKR